jgi:nitronate monooxygenase
MGGVARSDLVSAVSLAGGFGLLGMVRETPAFIREEVQKVRASTSALFGVSIIPAATDPNLLECQVATCIELAVPVVCLFWDLSFATIERLRSAGILVMCQVGSADEARMAQQTGAQVVVAQGREAGGHVRGRLPLLELLPQVLEAVGVPVLAAGGLSDGQDVATVLSLGAQGALLGTALLATKESFAHDFYKQAIVEAREGGTVLTDAFHINWPRGAMVRVLKNSVTQGERGDPFSSSRTPIGAEPERAIYLFSTDSPLRSTTGDLEAMALYAGEGAARIRDVTFAAERLGSIAREAAEALRVAVDAPVPRVEVSSPVCYVGELDPAYLGQAETQEVAETLNELLEAERAGARVLTVLARDVQDEALRQVLQSARRDEIRWCGMLIKAIQARRETPSTRTGDFFAKTMGIEGLAARLAFLDRGQEWVARRLRHLIPRLPEGLLQEELSEMLSSHEHNIAEMQNQLLVLLTEADRSRI